jgi:hypothetical protein
MRRSTPTVAACLVSSLFCRGAAAFVLSFAKDCVLCPHDPRDQLEPSCLCSGRLLRRAPFFAASSGSPK